MIELTTEERRKFVQWLEQDAQEQTELYEITMSTTILGAHERKLVAKIEQSLIKRLSSYDLQDQLP